MTNHSEDRSKEATVPERPPRIDLHVHIAGKGDDGDVGEHGCIMSKDFRSTPSYYLMLFAAGLLTKKINEQTIRDAVLQTIDGSEDVDKVVLLALDKPYNKDGSTRTTHLYTPNEYVAQLAEESNGRILFGASVHPDRPDWREELNQVVENHAVLIKWIPSVQNIDPNESRYKEFYATLASSNVHLPLLSHVGNEHAIPSPEPKNKEYRKLNRLCLLRPALEAGVTVIVAHCGLPVYPWDPDYSGELIDLMKEAETKEWNLYADISSLALFIPTRMHLIRRLIGEVDHSKFLFGTDYPIPISSHWPYGIGNDEVKKWLNRRRIKNPLDRNVQVIRDLGFDEKVFTNTAEILRIS